MSNRNWPTGYIEDADEIEIREERRRDRMEDDEARKEEQKLEESRGLYGT